MSIEFLHEVDEEVFYIDKNNEIKNGVIKYAEYRDKAYYIINDDRIDSDNVKKLFTEIKTKVLSELNTVKTSLIEEYDAKILAVDKVIETNIRPIKEEVIAVK